MKCHAFPILAWVVACGLQVVAQDAAPVAAPAPEAAVAPAIAPAPDAAPVTAPAAPVAVAPALDDAAAIRQQQDAVRAKMKPLDKSLNGFRQKVSSDPAVQAAKAKMEEARKAFDSAQRQALAAIPEAVGLMAEMDALKGEDAALAAKRTALEKAKRERK